MGYNSTLVIMNDALGQIEKDPDFGTKVAQAIMQFGSRRDSVDVSAGNHCNAATVVDCQHADVVSIIAIGGNHGTVMARTNNGGRHHAAEEQHKLLHTLAEKYGYSLRKKPEKAK